MIVHFICRGNAYRSRLAEAYFNSKKLPDIRAISSGVEEEIHRYGNGPVSWLAMRLLQYNSLIPFMSFMSQQTNKELLKKSDFFIFFDEKYLDYCEEKLGFNSSQYEAWKILDIDDYGLTEKNQSRKDDLRKLDISGKTFVEIKKKIDALIPTLVNRKK